MYLRNLILMCELHQFAPRATAETITDKQREAYIDSLLSKPALLPDPCVINKALASLEMPMYISDPDARVTQVCADFFERMESIGFGDYRIDNPESTMDLMMQKLIPKILQQAMKRCISYDKKLQEDVKTFSKVLKLEAMACQMYSSLDKQRPPPRPGQPSKHRYGEEPGPPTPRPSALQPPACLWTPHADKGIRHWFKNCHDCPEEEKNKLFDQLHTKKASGGKKT